MDWTFLSRLARRKFRAAAEADSRPEREEAAVDPWISEDQWLAGFPLTGGEHFTWSWWHAS